MKHVREIDNLIEKYNIGGIIFMQGGPVRQAKLINYFQKKAQTPLLNSIDGEFGLAMRLDSTPQFPRQMTLAAAGNDSLIYQMGREIGRECRRIGLQVNFAPVVDINNNPENPVISMRSFGEDKTSVAKKSYQYMKGLQDEHILACAKHFPGHGDTDKDSHKTLPVISQPYSRFDSLEFYPFRYLIDRGLGSAMVGHLFVPALDSTPNLPSTLSRKIVTGLLRNTMKFDGLIFTDALNMKGISEDNKPGVAEVKALMAGNDVLLFSSDVPIALEQIKSAIQSGQLTQEEIDEHCKKVLMAKYWAGLNQPPSCPTRHLYEELNTTTAEILNIKIAQASITLLKNNDSLLPLNQSDTSKIAQISLGAISKNSFSLQLSHYQKTDFFSLSNHAISEAYNELLTKLSGYKRILVQVNGLNQKPEENFGMSSQCISFLNEICKLQNAIIVFFSNPYLLNRITNLSHAACVVEAYEYNKFSQIAAADAICGRIPIIGKLPVSTLPFQLNSGIRLTSNGKLQVVNPQTLGIEKKKLDKIDSIAINGIREGAYPGCQVLAAKNGKVFYYKSFGTLFPGDSSLVTNQTVYDLASVTKIAASALALIDLAGKGKINLDKTLGDYIPDLEGTDKKNILIKDVLTHQAGLEPWIPFYLQTLNKDGSWRENFYQNKASEAFPKQVADSLFIKKEFTNQIYKKICESPLKKKEYKYSDLGYYYFKKIIEHETGTTLDVYLKNTFYSKMGLASLCYNPLDHFKLSEIAPTENDTVFRKQWVHGYVHDQGAALLGGVGGHAGLFGNAMDLAALMQMYMDTGSYGGTCWLNPLVVKAFTRYCAFCPDNRRGLCFDKPEMDEKKDSPVVKDCSPLSFGHSGFTGTFAWADPENGLVYVFLSNRICPKATNNKITKMGIRSAIHHAFYYALQKNNPTE